MNIQPLRSRATRLRLDRVSPTTARLVETVRRLDGYVHDYSPMSYSANSPAELDKYIAENLVHYEVAPASTGGLLSFSQVAYLYDAMCELNDVDVDAHYEFRVLHADGSVIVVEQGSEWDVLVRIADGTIAQRFENQASFAQAYGVQGV
jgi:hypothetical protein